MTLEEIAAAINEIAEKIAHDFVSQLQVDTQLVRSYMDARYAPYLDLVLEQVGKILETKGYQLVEIGQPQLVTTPTKVCLGIYEVI